jgi:hypothetical protein
MNKEDLEKQFLEAVELFDNEASGYFEIAEDAIQKIIEASEKHGIPFESRISPLRNSFIPRSFEQKWLNEIEKTTKNDLKNSLYDLLDLYIDKYHDEGWRYSAVC